MKKILFVETSSGASGSAAALFNMVSHIDRQVFEPFVASSTQGERIPKLAKGKLFEFKAEPERCGYLRFLLGFFTKTIPLSFQFYSFIKKNRIDIVHINTNIMLGLAAIIAAKLSKVRCVCHIRETRGLILREKLFLPLVDKFVLLNSKAAKLYSRYIRPEKIELVYDGIDLNGYANILGDSFRREFGLEGKPLAGIAGRVVQGKGHEVFLDAAKITLSKMPQARFIIAGDARLEGKQFFDSLKEKAVKDNIQHAVIFTGWRDDISGLISGLDVMVLASTTFPEGLPNCIIEAMALEKPIVSSNIPGPDDIVEDGQTGFLVKPGNPAELSERIVFLLQNKDRAKVMGQAGRKRVEKFFEIKMIIRRLEKIYLKLLEEQGRTVIKTRRPASVTKEQIV